MGTFTGIIRTEWSGTSGGPGLTQIAFNAGENHPVPEVDVQVLVNAMRTFWNAIAAYLPDELRLTVNPTVDVYRTADGELVSSTTAPTAPLVVAGTGTGSYAGGAGMKMTWKTSFIRYGRRVSGSTYIVPAVGSAFTTEGNIGGTPRSTIDGAGGTFLGSLNSANYQAVVWTRPTPRHPGRPGVVTAISSGSVGLKSAVLRGRRD